ncbi:MAG: hypothetical protein P8N02_19405 [Actinomycetota bacterium]|nr:hypothetical protein [Actinomycetota bacterium]
MEQPTFTFLGYEVERAAFVRGATVSAIVVLTLGVGLGSFIDEESDFSPIVTALIMVGFIAGGVVAGITSTRNHIVHGTLTVIPVAALAVGVQLIRRITSNDAAPWLSLVFIMFLATSLGTLGGVIGGRFSASRRSLLER